MGGGTLPEEEWERVFRLKRHLSDIMHEHTLADVMARERSPYDQGTGGNRAQRRKQDAINRRAKS